GAEEGLLAQPTTHATARAAAPSRALCLTSNPHLSSRWDIMHSKKSGAALFRDAKHRPATGRSPAPVTFDEGVARQASKPSFGFHRKRKGRKDFGFLQNPKLSLTFPSPRLPVAFSEMRSIVKPSAISRSRVSSPMGELATCHTSMSANMWPPTQT